MQGEYANPRWNPGLLKTYLNVINDEFAKGEFPNHPTDYIDSEAVAKLSMDTLYFSEGAIYSLAPDLPVLSDTGLARVYPFPMRIVTRQQLSDLILYGGKPMNYVAHYPLAEAKVYHNGKTSIYGNVTYKQINIYNSEKGVIYAHYPTDRSMLTGRKREAAPKFSVNDVADIADAVKQ